MDIDIRETMHIKDKEKNRLENIVKDLQQKLEARKVNNKSREAVEVNVDIIEVLEEEIITMVPTTKPPLQISKARPIKHVLSAKKVSICSHRQEIILEDIPEFEFKCHKCGKGFRHKGDLSEHMTCHTRRFCDCAFPCTPIIELKGPNIQSCSHCDEVFNTTMMLGDHLDRIHMDLDNLQHEGKGEEHIETEPPVTTGKHNCDICKNELSNRSDLFKHMNEHITPVHPLVAPPEAPQVTEEVEEASQDQQQTDEEDSNPPGAWQKAGVRFECPICGLTRNTQSQMQKHMQIHDEEEEDDKHVKNAPTKQQAGTSL